MNVQHQQIIDRVKQCIETGNRLYAMSMPIIGVHFDLKGRVGGMACRRGNQMFVRFNTDMIAREFEEMLNVVVPHEVAHCFCFMNPSLGKNHDYGWARVCRALGGTGDRTHDMDVVYGKGITYEYTTNRGQTVRLNDRRHAMVQQGRTLTYRKGLGMVSKTCAYSIVGARGQTLAQPIIKQGAPTKEVPVATIIAPPPVVQRPTPFVPPAPRFVTPVQAAPVAGESKAATSRRIMLSGHRAGHSYEAIIAAMMAANGYSRQLARATYLANAPKVGVPVQ